MNKYKKMEQKWESALKSINKLNFCGCGAPHEAFKAMLETLKAHDGGDDRHQTWEERCKSARRWAENLGGYRDTEGSGYDYLLLYFIDAAGFLEHGGSVGGSWLSQEGKDVVEFLEAWGTDPGQWPEMRDDEL